jgi:predicted small secreted protein
MNFKKRRFWLGATSIIILIAISLVLLNNGQSRIVSKDKTNEIGVHSEKITSFAWETINRDISNYELNPEVKIKESKITRLELIESFDDLADTPIDVYALEYRLLPEDLSKVVLAGGMDIDKDGWLKETSSMGSPLLVISRKIDSVELIGTLWSGGMLEEGVLKSSIKDLLQRNVGNQHDEIKFIETLNINSISPSVTDEIKKKLQSSISSMKEMGPGVGPWRIIYYNEEKIIFYNYAHIVACDISESNKGIYSIIELENLKVGSYQGSEIALIYPSPDAMACVIGTGCWEQDYQSTKSLYICNLNDSSVRELKADYNMANNKVTWYRNMSSSTLLPWYVSVKRNDAAIIWDVEKTRKLGSIPTGARLETVGEKYEEEINIETGYIYSFWWEKDENTVIGVPYKNGVTSSAELKLSDFEIIEVDKKDKTVKILYKIDI